MLNKARRQTREAGRERRCKQEALRGRDSGESQSSGAACGAARDRNRPRCGRSARQITASRPRCLPAAVQAQGSASASSQKAGGAFGRKSAPLTSAESSQALRPCANVANSSLSPDPSLLHVGSACRLYVLGDVDRSRRSSSFLFRFFLVENERLQLASDNSRVDGLLRVLGSCMSSARV